MMDRAVQRDSKLDALKGLIIFLVIWGHSIQYLNDGLYDFWHDWVFVIIYSFHMPLFMLISGYLACSGIGRKTAVGAIKGRMLQLVIPAVVWSVLVVSLPFGPKGGRGLAISVIDGYWFVSALFVIVIIVALLEKSLQQYGFIKYCAAFALLLFLPDVHSVGKIKYMFPFFVAGFYLMKHKSFVVARKTPIAVACLCLYPVVLAFWTKEYYVYTTGMGYSLEMQTAREFFVQSSFDVYRVVAGFVGSGFVVVIVSKVYRECSFSNAASKLGRASFGIYMIQAPFFRFLSGIKVSSTYTDSVLLYDFFMTLSFSMLVVWIFYLAVCAIRRCKWLSAILLGGR